MEKEKVIEWMPATLTFTHLPKGWTLCYDKAVKNSNGTEGALVRNDNTGRYCIYSASVFASIDQKFAKEISEAQELKA